MGAGVQVDGNGEDEAVNSQALMPVSPEEQPERNPAALGAPIVLLPVQLDVAVPIRDFRVRGLVSLEPGQIIESQWGHSEDLPLASGEVQLAWCEFEVIDTELGVRITRLA